jgi:archaellum component FlaC
MEARVARFEAELSEINATLPRLEPVLSQVSKDLANLRSKDLVELKVSVAKLEGRVSQLPSTVQPLGFVLAVLAIAGGTRFIAGP